MKSCIAKLADIGGGSLSSLVEWPQNALNGKGSGDFNGLMQLLCLKNGFYAFESALHVFPIESNENEVGLFDWNDGNLWIDRYAGRASNAFFFAEDIFGVQFCLRDSGVYSFDPESANFSFIAPNVEGWACAMLNDFDYLAGFPLAHDWQVLNGRLSPGKRLMPRVPFILGGAYSVDNLFAKDSVGSMRARAELAVQVMDLPDGASIELKFEE